MGLTGGLLQYPTGSGRNWIMIIESAALVPIGLTLGLLYLGGRPTGGQLDPADRNPSDHA